MKMTALPRCGAEILTTILTAAQEVLKHLEAHGVVVHGENPHADGELVPDPPHGSISLLWPHRNGREPEPLNLDPIDSRQETKPAQEHAAVGAPSRAENQQPLSREAN